MRKPILILIALILGFAPVRAQESIKIYLPVIFKAGPDMTLDNQFRLIQPVDSSNFTLNPSGETTSNFSAVSSATVTRVTTYAKYGLYSYEVVAAVAGRGIQLTLSALTNVEHFVTVRIRGNPHLQATIGSATKPLVLIEKIDDYWSLYGAAFSKAQANGQTAVQITVTKPGTFYLDGAQVEPLPYWTTYIDGTQEGCEWLGVAHAAISQRSASSRAGGRSLDFFEEYKFFIEKVVGAGAATRKVGVDSYATLPGGELNNVKVQSREFTIIGRFVADTEPELHEMRQALEAELIETTYPNSQPFRLRFNGAKVQKEIAANYQSGLEGDLAAFYGKFSADGETWVRNTHFTEKVAIQVLATDPFWYEVGESAALLDTNDSATFRTVAARLRSTGQWSALGPPNAAGTYTHVRAFAEDATYIYIGGEFLNFDNIANADYIVRYNKQAGIYSALGTGTNDRVNALVIGPDGALYAGGTFTLAGGVADTARIAKWNGSAWSALSTGANNTVLALAIGHDGTLYAGGGFTLMSGVANTANIAKWNGSAWTALGTGMNSLVWALAIMPNGDLVAGGDFTLASGVANTAYIARWNGSAWTALGTGMNSTVDALAVSSTGLLYAGGAFATAGGVTVNQIAQWNGTSFSAMSGGMSPAGANVVYTLAIGTDGVLYAGGTFTAAGSVTLADKVARWNGYAWSHLDVDLPGTPIVYAAFASKYIDPVVRQQYDIFLGFDTTGTGNFVGLTEVENEGSVPTYPKIIYYRSGGTSAIIETLKNERTGKELLFNYSLLDNETLTIDLTPTNKSIVSSFFGDRLDAVLANSDFGSWSLLKGDNDITSFVAVAGSPTVSAYMLWRESYSSY